MDNNCDLNRRYKEMMAEIAQVLREESQYDPAARRIDEIQARLLADAQGSDRLVLQRSAARMAFIAATDRDAPFDLLSQRFHARCELGFHDVSSELAVLTDYGFACAELGERDAGLQVVEQAERRLLAESSLPAHVCRQLSDLIGLCRRRLNHDEAP